MVNATLLSHTLGSLSIREWLIPVLHHARRYAGLLSQLLSEHAQPHSSPTVAPLVVGAALRAISALGRLRLSAVTPHSDAAHRVPGSNGTIEGTFNMMSPELTTSASLSGVMCRSVSVIGAWSHLSQSHSRSQSQSQQGGSGIAGQDAHARVPSMLLAPLCGALEAAGRVVLQELVLHGHAGAADAFLSQALELALSGELTAVSVAQCS